MAAFKFKLQRVLDIRSLEEKQSRLKYHSEKQKAQKLEKKVSLLQRQKNNIYEYLRDEDLSVEENLRGRNYLSLQIEKIERAQEALHSQNEKVDRAQTELINRKKKKEILEKLKEKEYEKFHEEFFRNQQKELDEIGIHFNESQEL